MSLNLGEADQVTADSIDIDDSLIQGGIRIDPRFWLKVDHVAERLFYQMDPHEVWENIGTAEKTMYHKAVVTVLDEFGALYVDIDNPGRMLEE